MISTCLGFAVFYKLKYLVILKLALAFYHGWHWQALGSLSSQRFGAFLQRFVWGEPSLHHFTVFNGTPLPQTLGEFLQKILVRVQLLQELNHKRAVKTRKSQTPCVLMNTGHSRSRGPPGASTCE